MLIHILREEPSREVKNGRLGTAGRSSAPEGRGARNAQAHGGSDSKRDGDAHSLQRQGGPHSRA